MPHAVAKAGFLLRRDHTLGSLLDELAAVHGNRRLAEEGGDRDLRLTYRQAAKRVARWAGGVVALGARPGDRVVVATPNGYEMLLLCLAVSRAGAIPVPVNPQMRRDEVAHVVADSGARIVIEAVAEVDGAEPLRRPDPASPGEVAAIFYTSGTTGAPKGARLTHRALLGDLGAGVLWPAALRRDEAVVALPVAHIMGFAVLLGLAVAGVPTYVLPRFRPDQVLDAIERRRATVFVGVPAMYRMLVEAGAEQRDLRSVRVWGSGADVMPPGLARRFQRMGASATLPFLGRHVGEAAFIEGYGMVELGGGAAVRVSPPMVDLPWGDSLGVPLPRCRFRVVGDDGVDVAPGAVGELWIKGPGVLEGYHGDAEATAAVVTPDGWLRTGDLARRGPFGTVAFAGRQKDVVKHGGYSVYAAEVEAVLEQHPAVAEAAVIGLPDERSGQVPAAVVRPAPGRTVDIPALLAWAGERLSDYKVPRRVVVADELPRTGTSKVQKTELQRLF